ncbi:ribbon-helix-helix protein [Azospirillum brasilense]|nr:ribbon-helix-helix protein [Azospirillum brasilense]
MRLEAAFWEGLDEIAQRENLTVGELCSRFAEQVGAVDASNLSSAVRVYVLEYFRAATPRRQDISCHPLAVAAE